MIQERRKYNKKTDNVVARLTIHDAQIMLPRRRKEIAEWLRNQAKALIKDGSNYSSTFRATFYG